MYIYRHDCCICTYALSPPSLLSSKCKKAGLYKDKLDHITLMMMSYFMLAGQAALEGFFNGQLAVVDFSRYTAWLVIEMENTTLCMTLSNH